MHTSNNHKPSFHQAEKKLNEFTFDGMQLGSTMAFFFDRMWWKDIRFTYVQLCQNCVRILFKSINKRSYLINNHAALIYLKTGGSRHHYSMENAIRQVHTQEKPVLVIGPEGEADLSTGAVFYHVGWKDLLHIKLYVIQQLKPINSILKQTALSPAQRRLFKVYLVQQLLMELSAKRFLQHQSGVKVIGVDYDRNSLSSMLITAAKSLGLSTFTLQHGIMYPPCGYVPVLAHRCLAWGEMAKQQFISMGESPETIELVGTPIVEPITLTPEAREKVRADYNLGSGKTWLLALSGPNYDLETKLAQFFKHIKETLGGPADNFLVKTHPSFRTIDYNWLESDYGLTLLKPDVPYAAVMNVVDVLLTHTSGIATEAIYYGKQVGIIDVPGYDAGSGRELCRYLDVPLLQKPSDAHQLLQATDPTTRESIARRVYYLTGKAAANEIAHRLSMLLES